MSQPPTSEMQTFVWHDFLGLNSPWVPVRPVLQLISLRPRESDHVPKRARIGVPNFHLTEERDFKLKWKNLLCLWRTISPTLDLTHP